MLTLLVWESKIVFFQNGDKLLYLKLNKINKKVFFLGNTFRRSVTNVKIKLKSVSWKCANLLVSLKDNNNLSSVILESSH